MKLKYGSTSTLLIPSTQRIMTPWEKKDICDRSPATMAAASIPLLANFRLQISISGCSFFAVNWWNIGIYKNLGFRDFTCPLASLEIDLNIYMCIQGVLLQGPDLRASGTLTYPPVIRHWQLVLKYFRYYQVEYYSLAAALPATSKA